MQKTTLEARYFGEGGFLFGLAFMTGLLTVVTLGIYRFWAKTRIRKYIWSSTKVGTDAFEYTGTGLEKLLGFLVAIVFLAVYLGIVQVLLFFVGIRFVFDATTPEAQIANVGVLYLSLLATVPLIFFAQYRARRYLMARTRLRSIRFGMTSEALGYVWRAIGYTLLSIITLGILLPRQTYYLEKYMADRMWYGNFQMQQGGKWTALYKAMIHVFIGFALLVAAGVLVAMSASSLQSDPPLLAFAVGIVGYIWLLIGFVIYRVRAFAYLTNTKVLGNEITFVTDPKTSTIIGRVVVGTIALGVLAAVGVGIAAAVMTASLSGADLGQGSGIAGLIVVGLLYLVVLVAINAAAIVLITQPVIAHIVDSTQVVNAEALSTVRQRAYDRGADADGFADALDIGGAI